MAKTRRKLMINTVGPFGSHGSILKRFARKSLGANPPRRRVAPPRKAVPPAEEHYPESYAGKWIAWTPDGRTIVASATTLSSVRRKAFLAGHAQIILERLPQNWEPVIDEPAR